MSETPQNTNNGPAKPKFRFNTATFKFLFIGILIVLMQIPLSMVQGVIGERQARNESVKSEISASWGGAQWLLGPIVVVPYKGTIFNGQGKPQPTTQYAFFMPHHYQVQAKVTPETRYRGIYKTTVYTSALHLNGKFDAIGTSQVQGLCKDLNPKDIYWDQAFLMLSVSDTKGIQTDPKLTVEGQALRFEPSYVYQGMQAKLNPASLAKGASFDIDFQLSGSQSLAFSPLGKDTQVKMASSWTSPSFVGSYLPSQRALSPEGFDATWLVTHYTRNYPQQWVGNRIEVPSFASLSLTALLPSQVGEMSRMDYTQASGVGTMQPASIPVMPLDEGAMWRKLGNSAFGTSLVTPVDFYQQAQRAAKYSALFLCLTFLTFFLFEVIVNQKIHIFQYTVVGFALALFYLILLAFTEIWGFLPAYVIGTAATTGLISFYTSGFITDKKQLWIMPTVLLALYSYLYVLLRLEDYSLLFGTVGLVMALGIVMRITRKIDWFNRDQNQ